MQNKQQPSTRRWALWVHDDGRYGVSHAGTTPGPDWHPAGPVEMLEPDPAHPTGAPVLYQHDDGRYGLSFGPAQFAVGEPAWHHVPIDVVERVGGGQSAAPADVTVLPDGSAFAVASYPLPQDHWLYGKRVYMPGHDEPVELPAPILTHADRGIVEAAVRYAVRGATMCGQETDFDPDALVQNAVYALCGPFTRSAQPTAATVPADEREAFEAAYAAHLNKQPIHARIDAVDYTRKEVAGMRVGDAYSDGYAYLNGCWAGWKFGRAGLAAPAAPQAVEDARPVAFAKDGVLFWHGDHAAWRGFNGEMYLGPQPAAQAAPAEPLIARALAEWHEDDGPVMWWAWCGHEWAGETPWCGTPLDSNWPGYHTHWTAMSVMPTEATGGDGLEAMQHFAGLVLARYGQAPAASAELVGFDRDALVDLIADHLSGTYHCTRVWEAWSVGTMSEEDFEDVGESETPSELADAIVARFAASVAAQAPQDERMETTSEHIARDIREGRFPQRSEPQRVQATEWGPMPDAGVEADAHVAVIEGDEAVRVLRWNSDVGAFSYPVGTRLYAAQAPAANGDAQ